MKQGLMSVAVGAVLSVGTASGGATVSTDAPGWTFTEGESPAFVVSPVASPTYWTVETWRGKPFKAGVLPKDGKLVLPRLLPGFYRVKSANVTGDAPTAFDFCVVTTNRCRAVDSFFAADAAISGCSRRGSYECPWYEGDCPRVTSELLGKCGIVHTRERLEWGPFISPKKGVRDFSRYLHTARWMKANGVVATGCFHDAPMWLCRPGGKLPADFVELYRFMEDAARTFDPYYDAWEFWNEPEGSSSPEPAWVFAAALKAYALGTRAGSPSTVILPPSLMSPERFGFGQTLFDSDVAKYVQAVNLHTYRNVSSYPNFHAEVRAFMKDLGLSGWQVWLTESGTALDGNGRRPSSRTGLMAHDAEQEMVLAEFAPKSAVLHQMGGIFRNWFFLFGCYNEQAGRRDWGTMRRDGTVKPIHASLSTLTSELGDAKLLGEKRVVDGVRAFVYRKPDGTHTLVYWSESDVDTSRGEVVRLTSECVRTFAFPVADGGYRFVDMMGTPSVVESRAGSVSLAATRWPSYLTGLPPIGVDVLPTDSGRLARYEPAADVDLTVVLCPVTNPEDFSITGRKCLAEMGCPEGRISVEVWNLSPHAKKGRLFSSGNILKWTDGEVSLPPWGKAVVECSVRHEPSIGLNFNVDIYGVFDGKRTTRSRIPCFNRHAFLQTCVAEEWPALNDTASWTRNDSGNSYSAVFDAQEKSVLFEVKWDGSKGAWFFPVHRFKDSESFSGAKYLEFEVKSWQDKVENDMILTTVMCLYPDGSVKEVPYDRPVFEWERRRVKLPDDADQAVGFRVGGLPKGKHLKYWIRNFRVLKAR